MGLFVDGLTGRLLLLEGGEVSDAINAERVISRKVFQTDISALKVVKDVDKDTVGIASPTTDYADAAATGIALTTTEAGQRGVVLNQGYLNDAVFSFTVGTVLLLGANGEITTELLSTATHQTIIGRGTGAGGIYVLPEPPLIIGEGGIT